MKKIIILGALIWFFWKKKSSYAFMSQSDSLIFDSGKKPLNGDDYFLIMDKSRNLYKEIKTGD